MSVAIRQPEPRKYYQAFAALLWLALPANLLLFVRSWNRLPSRVATHFDFSSQPNGWTTREGLVIFSFVVAIVTLITATFILLRVRKPDPTAWSLLFLFYVVLSMQLWAEKTVIEYNITGTPVNVTPVLFVLTGTAVFVIVVALLSRRGIELGNTTSIAEERHASASWGLLMFTSALLLCAIASIFPVTGARMALMSLAILVGVAGIMAWSGFRYVFTPSGLEIRTLGFRLRSIPASEINSYSVDRWTTLGGYGIRGVGDTRAYVWSKTGVRIHLNDGEVFLGHKEPGRIIHDLDLVTSHKGHEGTLRA
jgi:hypothetical protein